MRTVAHVGSASFTSFRPPYFIRVENGQLFHYHCPQYLPNASYLNVTGLRGGLVFAAKWAEKYCQRWGLSGRVSTQTVYDGSESYMMYELRGVV